jgi:hypothetical protein
LAGISRHWKIENRNWKLGKDANLAGTLAALRDDTPQGITCGTDLKVGHYKKINLAGARMWLA